MPEMIVPEKVRKGLYRAAEYLERHGWCLRQHQDAAGRVCVLGAITESIREAYDLGEGDLWRDPQLWSYAGDLEQALDDYAICVYAETGMEFSANDLRLLLPDVRRPLIGARFLAARKRGAIEPVSYTRRPIRVRTRALGAHVDRNTASPRRFDAGGQTRRFVVPRRVGFPQPRSELPGGGQAEGLGVEGK